jgi:hypothetical protein
MKVGDLVRHTPSNTTGLIIDQDEPEGSLMIQWFDEYREIEDVALYSDLYLEVIQCLK